MSRTIALSIFENDAVKAELNEIQAGTMDNLQKSGNSFKVKSQAARLDEKAGSYEFKRYENSVNKQYGTARLAAKGDLLTAPPVTVNMDINQEIVEEISKFDAERFGVEESVLDIVRKRKTNHQMTMQADIESRFWAEAYRGAVVGNSYGSGLKGQIVAGFTSPTVNGMEFDAYIDEVNHVALETVKNVYTRGIPRNYIMTVAQPKAYSKLKSRLNTMYNANFAVADEELQGINGVAVFSELYLPPKVESITIVKEAVANPLTVDEYGADRLPLSNDWAAMLFYDMGIKCLAADHIVVGIEMDTGFTKVSAVAALPTTGQDAATVYVLTAKSATYNPYNPITSTNFPAGTMFKYVGSAWAQYNV